MEELFNWFCELTMVFTPPSWVPELSRDPPDSITVSQFMHDETYGRVPLSQSRNPFTCGLTGKSFTAWEYKERSQHLARAISKELAILPNHGNEWNKVIAIFSLNSIDLMTVSHATHDLGGILSPANAAYSAAELTVQLKLSGAIAIFTCIPLLDIAVQGAKAAGIPNENIFILELPSQITRKEKPSPFKTVDILIAEGKRLAHLDSVKFSKGQGAAQTAYLCYSSGTSGSPKGVMMSHRNVISVVLQLEAFERLGRARRGGKWRTEILSGLLPQAHLFGLVAIGCVGGYRGDEVIILPKFDFLSFLKSIQSYKITRLYLVPPIIIQIVKNRYLCLKYNLSSVHSLVTGAAPLGRETAEDLNKLYPSWKILQGYGLTESTASGCITAEHDIWHGTCGSLLPGNTAKLLSPEGVEIIGYGLPGELFIQSPSVMLGYLKNDAANKETFVQDIDGIWLRTGDQAIISKSPSGNEHITITERIKEMIKVKGLQVAPAELEAHLLSHPSVADAAVISILDDAAGELPKAYIVKSSTVAGKEDDSITAKYLLKYVEDHKAHYKWIKGGIDFVSEIPKTSSGKILRRELRDLETRKQNGSKL